MRVDSPIPVAAATSRTRAWSFAAQADEPGSEAAAQAPETASQISTLPMKRRTADALPRIPRTRPEPRRANSYILSRNARMGLRTFTLSQADPHQTGAR